MEIRKLKETIPEKRQRDDAAARIAQLEANQDYIAMMSDIDLGDDDASEGSEESEDAE